MLLYGNRICGSLPYFISISISNQQPIKKETNKR